MAQSDSNEDLVRSGNSATKNKPSVDNNAASDFR